MDQTPTSIEVAQALRCVNCDKPLQTDEKFCGYCGHEVAGVQPAFAHDPFAIIRPTLIYYFITLILLGIYKLTEAFPDGIDGLVVISIIDAVVVLAFWAYFFRDLIPLFSLRKVRLEVALLTVGGAVVAAIVVNFLADLINISLFDDVYYNPYLFEDTSEPLIWAIGMTCLYPAVFEEVAFRGFMFTNLQALASPRGAIYVSAVLFGIMHLSLISLIWLIPLGIAFAILRVKYDTLWYGILGHFTYNFTITVLEFYSAS